MTWTHRSLQGRWANCKRSMFLLSQTSRGSKTSRASIRVMCLASILVGIKNHENWKKKKDTQPTVPRQWNICVLVIHCDNDTRIVRMLTFTALDSRFLIVDWFVPGYANNECMHNRCHTVSALRPSIMLVTALYLHTHSQISGSVLVQISCQWPKKAQSLVWWSTPSTKHTHTHTLN